MAITVRSGRNKGQDGLVRVIAGATVSLILLAMGLYTVFSKSGGFDLGTKKPKLVGAGMIAGAVFIAVAIPTLVVDFDGGKDESSEDPSDSPVGGGSPGTDLPESQPPVSQLPAATPLADFCTTNCFPLELATAGEPTLWAIDPQVVNPLIVAKLTEFGAQNVTIPTAIAPGVVSYDDTGFVPSDAQVQELLDIVLAQSGVEPSRMFFDIVDDAIGGNTFRILEVADGITFPSGTAVDVGQNPNTIFTGFSTNYPGISCAQECPG